MSYTLHLGDCRTVLATLDANSIDSIVTDPPYELGFMGKAWDNSGIAYDVTVWQQCLRVLKPGGHLLAFGGSRTYHRMAVAIEDAGFDIRDQIMWIYGNGFPKSLNIGKALDKQAGAMRNVVGKSKRHGGGNSQIIIGDYNPPITAPATDLAKTWDGWGTALKPAHEPICVARKPLIGTVADNVLTYGVGGINIDGCRVEGLGWYRKDEGFGDPGMLIGKKQLAHSEMYIAGRWPANIIFDEEAGRVLDEQSGKRKSPKPSTEILYGQGDHYETENIYRKRLSRNIPNVAPYGDSGGASRFFYTAKASRSEREAGLSPCDDVKHNHHPTVKPLDLMQYLVRLVTPKGGTVLDPFLGSGSTGCAAILESFDFVGIDITPEYIDIATKRLVYYSCASPLDGV